jgi:hypothetical protein
LVVTMNSAVFFALSRWPFERLDQFIIIIVPVNRGSDQ